MLVTGASDEEFPAKLVVELATEKEVLLDPEIPDLAGFEEDASVSFIDEDGAVLASAVVEASVKDPVRVALPLKLEDVVDTEPFDSTVRGGWLEDPDEAATRLELCTVSDVSVAVSEIEDVLVTPSVPVGYPVDDGPTPVTLVLKLLDHGIWVPDPVAVEV